MLLHIHHTTRYAYEAPLRLSTQVLRLTPRPTPALQVQRWALDLPGRAVPFPDTWGNAAHVLTLDGAEHVEGDERGTIPQSVGEALAHRLLAAGGDAILARVKNELRR